MFISGFDSYAQVAPQTATKCGTQSPQLPNSRTSSSNVNTQGNARESLDGKPSGMSTIVSSHVAETRNNTWGLTANASEKSANSWLIARKSPTGSGEAPLTIWMMARHLFRRAEGFSNRGLCNGECGMPRGQPERHSYFRSGIAEHLWCAATLVDTMAK